MGVGAGGERGSEELGPRFNNSYFCYFCYCHFPGELDKNRNRTGAAGASVALGRQLGARVYGPRLLPTGNALISAFPVQVDAGPLAYKALTI